VCVCVYKHNLVAHSESPHPSHIVALFHIVVTIDRRKCLVIVMDIDCVFYEVGTDILCGKV